MRVVCEYARASALHRCPRSEDVFVDGSYGETPAGPSRGTAEKALAESVCAMYVQGRDEFQVGGRERREGRRDPCARGGDSVLGTSASDDERE